MNAVFVDGSNYGAVCDAIANNKQLASDIQRALQKYCSDSEAAQTKALDDLHAETVSAIGEANVQLETAQSEIEAAKAETTTIKSKLDAITTAYLDPRVDTLAVLADVLQDDTEKAKAQAQADLVAAQAKLDALNTIS